MNLISCIANSPPTSVCIFSEWNHIYSWTILGHNMLFGIPYAANKLNRLHNRLMGFPTHKHSVYVGLVLLRPTSRPERAKRSCHQCLWCVRRRDNVLACVLLFNMLGCFYLLHTIMASLLWPRTICMALYNTPSDVWGCLRCVIESVESGADKRFIGMFQCGFKDWASATIRCWGWWDVITERTVIGLCVIFLILKW